MLNSVALMGRFVDTPQLKATVNGTYVTTFCLAVTGYEKNDDGTRKANFIDCVAWREAAEFICKHFAKGRLIAVAGEITTRSYKTKDGAERKVTEINVKSAEFTGERSEPQ